MVNYLHGIETLESNSILPGVSEVKSAVIGIVGTASCGPVNEPVLIQSAADAAQFGDFAVDGLTSGFTLPYALNAVREYGAGTIIAVNVFEPKTTSVTAVTVTNEIAAFEEGSAQLAHTAVSEVVVKSTDGETTYTADTDYELDAAQGLITKVEEGGLATVESVKVTYKYHQTVTVDRSPSDVTNADIIGTVGANGRRTGAQAFLDCFSRFGFNPKILIAPGFSQEAGVHNALLTLAETLRAVVLIDMPAGLSVTDAIAARNPSGAYNIVSDRAMLLYPHLLHYDIQTDANQLMPYSAAMAGLIAKTDHDYGYWYSPSNRLLTNVTGLENHITSSYSDASSEVQRLNEKGITSVLNAYGTGYRAYGNRLTNSIGSDGLESFLTTRRVCDMIAEALEQTMAQFIDLPLTAPIINDIITVGSSYINTLKNRGAVVGGRCYVHPTENTADTLAKGRLHIVYEYNPPAPLERISQTLVLTNRYYE